VGRGRDREWGAVAAITVKAAAVRAEDKVPVRAWARVEDKVPARANARGRRTEASSQRKAEGETVRKIKARDQRSEVR